MAICSQSHTKHTDLLCGQNIAGGAYINRWAFENCGESVLWSNLSWVYFFFLPWCNSPPWSRASSVSRVHDHTQRRITVGRTPLDEWSARRRDPYLTTHNTLNRPTSCPRRDSNAKLQRAAPDRRLRLRGHWDRQLCILYIVYCISYIVVLK